MLLDRVDRYVFLAPVPYFFISLCLFTLILVIQQATKFAELVSSTQFPFDVTFKLLLLVIPGVLMFTVPMASIVGAAVGYSRLLNDSELTALSAGGVSTVRCLRPAFFGGALLLLFSLYTGFSLIPKTARQLRQTAGEIVLEKLASPVEPKSFFTGFPGKVIYVQSGDREDGSWRNIFIHWLTEEGSLRLITAEGGRLNPSEDGVELYLRNAVVTNINKADQITSEKATELHLRDERLDQYKSSFAQNLRNRELNNEELGWQELLNKSATDSRPAERREAQMAFHRRLALCVSPLILAVVGALTVLRGKKGGKLSGIFISVVLMLSYYLLFLVGEQLTRAQLLSPTVGLWMAPFGFSLLACALLSVRPRGRQNISGRGILDLTRLFPSFRSGVKKGAFVGLFDRYILKSLLTIFIGILITLNSIFLLFTLFELLKFISRNNIGAETVFSYLLFLTPYSALILIPPCTFFAVLIGFTLMVRRSEGVIWLSAGLSVLRIVVPALVFSSSVGLAAQFIQNNVSPVANKRQNDLRRYIRSGERTLSAQNGEVWVSAPEEKRIYLFNFARGGAGGRPDKVSLYEFDDSGIHLGRLIQSAPVPELSGGGVIPAAKAYRFGPSGARPDTSAEFSLPEAHIQSLNSGSASPEELSTKELSDNLRVLKAAGLNTAPVYLELENRRLTPFVPVILTLLAAPFVFLQPRQKLTNGIYQSVAIMLLFLISSRVFHNLGGGGYLPSFIAVWSVPILFSSFGLYLLTRVKT